MLNSSIWPIDTTHKYDQVLPLRVRLDLGVLQIPQSSSITGASLLNCLVSDPAN